jgi:iron(III) transport system ATP-binding protein
MQDVISDIATHFDTTCVLVSHDAADLLPWANRMLLIKEGAIIRDDAPATIFYSPQNEYEAEILGACNCISVSIFPVVKTLIPEANDNQQLFIRPSQLSLVKATGKEFEGTIKRVAFCGSHYLITVQINELTLQVASLESDYMAGESYEVCLKENAKYFLL